MARRPDVTLDCLIRLDRVISLSFRRVAKEVLFSVLEGVVTLHGNLKGTVGVAHEVVCATSGMVI